VGPREERLVAVEGLAVIGREHDQARLEQAFRAQQLDHLSEHAIELVDARLVQSLENGAETLELVGCETELPHGLREVVGAGAA
jgi:hypothetical protein